MRIAFTVALLVATTLANATGKAQTQRGSLGGASSPPSESKNSGVKNQPTRHFKNCAEARAAGAAPIRRGEPGYAPHLDRDGDGIACEPYRKRR